MKEMKKWLKWLASIVPKSTGIVLLIFLINWIFYYIVSTSLLVITILSAVSVFLEVAIVFGISDIYRLNRIHFKKWVRRMPRSQE